MSQAEQEGAVQQQAEEEASRHEKYRSADEEDDDEEHDEEGEHQDDEGLKSGDHQNASFTSSHSPTVRRQLAILGDCCRQAEIQYEKLSEELRIPILDDTLYRKYLFPSSGPPIEDHPAIAQGRLKKLLKLLDVLTRHKEATLHVLEQITKREECYREILTLEGNQTLQSLELQSVALQALYQLQHHTLAVVEAISQWRQSLSLPYAFIRGDVNYLLRISESMHALESSEIGKVLPLQFARFPLLSNVPSMKLFKEDPNHLTYPLRSQKSSVTVAESPVFRKRLVTAEQLIHAEVEQQLANMSFLMRRCRDGYFVPVIDLVSCGVYPSMRSGGGAAKSKSRSSTPASTTSGAHSPKLGGLVGIKIASGRHQAELFDGLVGAIAKLKDGPIVLDEEEDEEDPTGDEFSEGTPPPPPEATPNTA